VGTYPQLAKFDDFGPQFMETLNQAVDDLIFNMVLSVPGTVLTLNALMFRTASAGCLTLTLRVKHAVWSGYDRTWFSGPC
jgi:hypothetical protein